MNAPTVTQRIRRLIFEHFDRHGVPPVVEQLMVEFSLARDDAAEILRELDAARHIALVRGTARILMAFPYSAIATPFRVTTKERTYFANCAWDAVAFHAMLDEADVTVDSACHHCAEPIHIEMRGGSASVVEPADAIVYLALKPTQWWEDIVTTCSNTMVFFSSEAHRDASDLCAPPEQAASLTPDQVHALSGPIYRTKFAVDYARPGKDELLAHFAALGLTGEYWKL
ncbi:MAG: alkylmercury lyase family protein [Chloroflexi bacterium]|nr:alkylmercury lyase family protein [Chloroflexota bacterium]